MGITDFALAMWPSWTVGLLMMLATVYSRNSDLLKIDLKSVKTWIKFLILITIGRAVFLSLMWDTKIVSGIVDVSWIPWQVTLTVFWEDAAHVLPLLLLMRLIGVEKKTWPIHIAALLFMWTSFGVGHIYQGILSAIYISFYIPITLRIARDKGIGTVMICHILYDLCTIILVQTMSKVMV